MPMAPSGIELQQHQQTNIVQQQNVRSIVQTQPQSQLQPTPQQQQIQQPNAPQLSASSSTPPIIVTINPQQQQQTQNVYSQPGPAKQQIFPNQTIQTNQCLLILLIIYVK